MDSLCRGAKLVGRFVAFNTQGVEQFFDLKLKPQLTVQSVKQVGLRGLFVKFEARLSGQMLRQAAAA
jgi:hypothetical protein